MSIGWGLALFYVGGALGMYVTGVSAANRVAEARRVYWRRRTKLLRKRRAEWDARRAGRLAAAQYRSHQAALETQLARQTGRPIAILPVTYVSLRRGVRN